MIHKKIEELREQGEVRVVPVSADAENPNCDGPGCDGPDAAFLNKIKDESLEKFLDSTKRMYSFVILVFSWFRNMFSLFDSLLANKARACDM